MRHTALLILLTLVSSFCFGQNPSSSESPTLAPITINVNDIDASTDLMPYIHYLGKTDGFDRNAYRIQQIKDQVAMRFPKKRTSDRSSVRGGAPPQILDTFGGLNNPLGIPLDNHLAVNNNGQMVAVANFNFVVYEGDELKKALSLIQLTRPLRLPAFRYDPRVIYDPASDRFIMAILHGSSRDQTDIILAFSQTNDPTGDWNFYLLDGNPFDQTIFSDYPMLSVTTDGFYLTINAVDDELSWQEGFVETYIWKMDKFQGYNGDSLTPQLINEIKWNDKPIRNLCPVNSGDEKVLDKAYFMSNRNFDVQNDTLFLVELDDNNDVSVRAIITDTPYGVPPNADQGTNDLQTNDARVLDAFLQDGHIQWVGNCVNPDNGLAAFYHGIIEDVETSTTATGTIISDGDLELGYPDLCYMGTAPGDRHSLIVTSHVSLDRFPGISALEYNGLEYSPLATLKEGENVITELGGGVERWGDYAGNQRVYNAPGQAWVNASYGRETREYGVWIGHLLRSDLNVSTDGEAQEISSNMWPNPSTDFIQLEFTPPSAEEIDLSIYNLQGQRVRTISQFSPKKDGKIRIGFNINALPQGQYIVQGVQEGQTIIRRSFIRS